MLRIIRLFRARQDLIDIWQFVAQSNPEAADALLDAIDVKCNLLGEHPYLGPSKEDIRPGLRYLVIGQYVSLYKVDKDAVRIVRVLHARRDLDSLFTK